LVLVFQIPIWLLIFFLLGGTPENNCAVRGFSSDSAFSPLISFLLLVFSICSLDSSVFSFSLSCPRRQQGFVVDLYLVVLIMVPSLVSRTRFGGCPLWGVTPFPLFRILSLPSTVLLVFYLLTGAV